MTLSALTKISASAILAMSILFSAVTSAGQYNAILSIGDSMPSFNKLPDIDGTQLSSKDITESVVVLVSLANHCPWVKGLDAGLVALANEFKDKDVRIIGFSVNDREDDRLPAMKEHAKKVGYSFSYVYDETQALGRQLGATRTPEYFVFDKARRLQYTGLLHDSPARIASDGKVTHINGEPKVFYVKDAIDALLTSKPIAMSETRAHGCSVKYKAKS